VKGRKREQGGYVHEKPKKNWVKTNQFEAGT